MRFRVLIDGQPPGAARGIDVDGLGKARSPTSGCVNSSGQRGPVTEHTFEIKFLDPGVQADAFTFG